MKKEKITLNEYFKNKGELHRNEVIYDSKEDFFGWFDSFDLENLSFINVRKSSGLVKCNFVEYMVEIECTPIYVAL